MKEYHKIETLLDRNDKFKVIPYKWRLPEFEYLKDNQWLFTEKIDGTNIRVMWMPEVGKKLGGKTDNAQIPPFLVDRLNTLFPEDKLRSVFPDSPVCLYGEGYGAKIQSGGKYIPDGCDFILFDVKIGDWWLERANIENIASKLNINFVPIVGEGTLKEAIDQTKEGINSAFGNFIAEGLVVRPPITLFTRKGERLIGKIKTKDF
jgi:ATP-dependent RNA circularization protein (DNA/RNA ligase family)